MLTTRWVSLEKGKSIPLYAAYLSRHRAQRLDSQQAYAPAGFAQISFARTGNILKRLVMHSGAANLGLPMRKLFGKGTPRGLAGALRAILSAAKAPTGLRLISAMLVRTFGGSIARAKTTQLILAAA
jgi:hypothetical protein